MTRWATLCRTEFTEAHRCHLKPVPEPSRTPWSGAHTHSASSWGFATTHVAGQNRVRHISLVTKVTRERRQAQHNTRSETCRFEAVRIRKSSQPASQLARYGCMLTVLQHGHPIATNLPTSGRSACTWASAAASSRRRHGQTPQLLSVPPGCPRRRLTVREEIGWQDDDAMSTSF